jgi:hypothetical protein
MVTSSDQKSFEFFQKKFHSIRSVFPQEKIEVDRGSVGINVIKNK